MTEQEDDDSQVWEPENPTDFKVYDVPTELKNDYISMAKLHYDDDVWKVMADAMASLKEDKFGRVDMLEEKIAQLEEEIGALKALVSKQRSEDDEDDLQPTLGGGD
jgi:uncharacterized small protein (DUF1192 family)